VVARNRRPNVAAARRARSRLGQLAFAVALTLVSLAVAARRAYSHPLHTTLAEVSVAPDGGLQIVLRAFVDDFAAAVSGRAVLPAATTVTPHDSSTARYLGAALVVTDAAGRRQSLTVAGTRRSGDLVWVTLRAPSLRSPTGARLTNRVLFERYDDQVNIVQTSVGGRRQTLLFTKREGAVAKAI